MTETTFKRILQNELPNIYHGKGTRFVYKFMATSLMSPPLYDQRGHNLQATVTERVTWDHFDYLETC